MEYEFLDLADVVPGKDRLPLNWGVLGLLRKPGRVLRTLPRCLVQRL